MSKVNKANEKLNDYLMAERQRSLIKYDIDLEEAPLLDTDFMMKSDSTEVNDSQIIGEQMFCAVQPDQFNVQPQATIANDSSFEFEPSDCVDKLTVQLQSDASPPPPPQYNHVININSGELYAANRVLVLFLFFFCQAFCNFILQMIFKMMRRVSCAVLF